MLTFYKACNGGHIPACYHLGILMYFANGNKDKNEIVTKKQLDALKVLEKSCEAGDVESCYFTGGHNIRKGNYLSY